MNSVAFPVCNVGIIPNVGKYYQLIEAECRIYSRQWTTPSLVQIMDCRLVDAKPLSEPMIVYCYLDY